MMGMQQNGFLDYKLGVVVQNKITWYWFLPSCISISPVLWWASARALWSSTCRGFKVGQDDREREAPPVRSRAGFWPAKISEASFTQKAIVNLRTFTIWFLMCVCFPTLHVPELTFSMLLVNISMCASPMMWISQLWCGTLSVPEA